MPIIDGEYIPRERDTIRSLQAEQLLTQQANANPDAPSTYTYALQYAIAATIAQQQEQDLKELYQSAYIRDATGDELTKKAENLGVIRRDPQRATGVIQFNRSSSASQDYVIPSGTIVETLEEDAVQFETTEQVTLASGTSSVKATIRALEGGSDGNVGTDSIQAIPSKPTGVDTATNPQRTGDPTLTDTNGDPLNEGKDRETDTELRQRVFDTDAVQEAPSAPGIAKALDSIDGLASYTVNINDTNSIVDGIDPYHTEIVCFGGDVLDIAQTLRDVLSVTTLLRLQGGVNGSKETTDITADFLNQTITVPITRPTEDTLELNVDIVHTEAYDGDSAVKDAIITYIGGTRTDGTAVTGQGIGEPILVNEIENVAEDVQGVAYANLTLLDSDSDGNDDTTTDSDGVPIYDVADTAVSRVDAADITLNTTAR